MDCILNVLKISTISFEYSVKVLELFKCFKSALSRLFVKNLYFASDESLDPLWFIKLNNTFVFPDPEPPVIKILYGQFGLLSSFMFFYNIIRVNLVFFYNIVTFNLCLIQFYIFASHIGIWFYWINCLCFLSLLALNAILSTSSVKTLGFLLLNLCCDFNIFLLFFMNSLWFSLRLSTFFYSFLVGLFIFMLSCF